jgi:predicted RNase H-like HicB family nuclease
MRYDIALRRTEEGYVGSVVRLPGCWSQRATEAEALANIRDAMREYLAARDELLLDAEVRERRVTHENVYPTRSAGDHPFAGRGGRRLRPTQR